MLIQQGYKYRLEPTAEQAARLAVLCGHARFVWNHGLRHSRAIEGKIKNCTISQRAGHWYISFLAERRIEKPQHPSSTAAGIDMGVAQFVTLSDGSHKEPLNAYRKHQKKLAIEQRKLARKVKFSQNWVKQNRVLQRLNCA
jgi:putative transposase